ncbi:MAG: restriction endonuclease subunit S [Ignavibacteria bacterium]|nr:restriction endonuclease subunit S [Ignavibacteria bacterium]
MKWDNYQLKDIANYWTGKVEAGLLDATNYISTDNLVPDRGGVVNSNYVPTSGNANSYSENDVLISNIRPYFKKIWFADKQGGCSNDVLVFRAKENVEPLFLYYQLSKDAFFDDMVAGSNGTKMPRGNKTSIMEFKLQIPPLPTQHKIASILSAYDDLIENNLKRIKLLEEKAFLRYKGIVKEEKLEKHILSEFGYIITGKTPSTTIADYFGDDVPFIKTPDMHNQIFIEHTDQMLSELGAKSQEKKFLPPLSLSVSCIGTAGVVGITSKPSQTNQQINSIVFYEPKNVYFFYSLMSQMKEQLDALGSNGSTFTNVNKNKFENMEVFVPNQKVLNEYAEEFEAPFKLILTLQKQNAKLREARDILLPRLMNGEIEV